MELQTAQELAAEVAEKLKPYCSRIEVAGSIRRRRQLCHDIDLVVQPANQGQLALALRELGPVIKSGPLIHACRYRGQQVDVYIASETTWVTLLLIRTGSKEHNIQLCSRARALGMKLHADGSGIELDTGERLHPLSEEDIFRVLKLPYKRPEERI